MFSPLPKPTAKRLMGIDPGSVVVLFGAEILTEIRKGTKELLDALHFCLSDATSGLWWTAALLLS